MKLFVRGFLAFAAMLAALFVTAGPAQAEDCGECWYKYTVAAAPYKSEAGEALFDAYGEYLYVFDWDKDGAGVVAHFSVNYGAWQQRTNTKGADTQATWNLDYSENLSFRFFVCISNNGTNIASTCSSMVYANT